MSRIGEGTVTCTMHSNTRKMLPTAAVSDSELMIFSFASFRLTMARFIEITLAIPRPFSAAFYSLRSKKTFVAKMSKLRKNVLVSVRDRLSIKTL